MSSDSDRAEAVSAETQHRRVLRRRRWLLVILAAVVVLVLGVAGWTWRHSDQSFPDGYGIEMRRQGGQPVWTTLIHSGRPGAEQVTITDLEPQIEADGAEVDVEYLICELDPEMLAAEGVGGFGYGRQARDVERYCTSTRPAEGATFPLRSQPPQELLVGITPTRSGRTVVSGHRVSFDVGWQRGSDEIEVEVVIVARAPVD